MRRSKGRRKEVGGSRMRRDEQEIGRAGGRGGGGRQEMSCFQFGGVDILEESEGFRCEVYVFFEKVTILDGRSKIFEKK